MKPVNHRLKTSAAEILTGPEYFECERLGARISARQCLLNQGKADGFRAIGTRFMGKMLVCLDCPEGRQMMAYPPGVFQLPVASCQLPVASCQLPVEPRAGEKKVKAKKLPAWLKDATPAVRRDYLKDKDFGG